MQQVTPKNFWQWQLLPGDLPFAIHAVLRQGISQACLQIEFAVMLQRNPLAMPCMVATNNYGVTKAAVSVCLSLVFSFTRMDGRVGSCRWWLKNYPW